LGDWLNLIVWDRNEAKRAHIVGSSSFSPRDGRTHSIQAIVFRACYKFRVFEVSTSMSAVILVTHGQRAGKEN
jgi:hypothetical protein